MAFSAFTLLCNHHPFGRGHHAPLPVSTPYKLQWHGEAAEASAKGRGVMEVGVGLKAEKSAELACEEDKACSSGWSPGRKLGLWWEGKDHHCFPQHSPGATSLGNGLLNCCRDFFSLIFLTFRWKPEEVPAQILASMAFRVSVHLGMAPPAGVSPWQLWSAMRQPPKPFASRRDLSSPSPRLHQGKIFYPLGTSLLQKSYSLTTGKTHVSCNLSFSRHLVLDCFQKMANICLPVCLCYLWIHLFFPPP